MRSKSLDRFTPAALASIAGACSFAAIGLLYEGHTALAIVGCSFATLGAIASASG